jgi:glycosyltransferase involved in cell wall biosynthesis
LSDAGVTVIVPAYDAAVYLSEALESACRQEPRPYELIVVDDGSTDGTAELAERLGAVCVRQENRGPSAARNRANELARTRYLGFLDADDLWPSGSLARRLQAFESQPSLEVVWGESQMFRDREQALSPLARGFMFQVGAALFRRSAFDRVGVFDESLRLSEDVDWFLRAREAALPMQLLAEVTCLYRQHAANLTRGKSTRELRFLSVIKASFERRRRSTDRPRPLPPLAGE